MVWFVLTRLHSIYLTTGRSKLMGRGPYSWKSIMLKRQNLPCFHLTMTQEPQPEMIHRCWMPMVQRFAVLSWADTAAVPSQKRMESQLLWFRSRRGRQCMSANTVKNISTRFIRPKLCSSTRPSQIAKVKTGKCHWCWPDDLVSLRYYLVIICWRVQIVASLQVLVASNQLKGNIC